MAGTLEMIAKIYKPDESASKRERNRQLEIVSRELNDREPYHLRFTNLSIIDDIGETLSSDNCTMEYWKWQEKYSGNNNENVKNLRFIDVSEDTDKDYKSDWDEFITNSLNYAKNGGQNLRDDLLSQKRNYVAINTIYGDIVYIFRKFKLVDFTKYYGWVLDKKKEPMELGGSLVNRGMLYQFVLVDKLIDDVKKS